MTKLTQENRKDYDNTDHCEWVQTRRQTQDKKWKLFSLENPKNKNINLGIHEEHDWHPIKGPFGPHAGKIICNTCGGKFIKWLPKGI